MSKKTLNSLKTLQRLQKNLLDDLRQELYRLEQSRHQITEKINSLEETLNLENEAASVFTQNHITLSQFHAFIRKSINALHEQIAILEGEITTVREKLIVVFQEEKKYEKAIETEEKEQQLILNRQEQSVLDEMATIQKKY
jgi:flagellar export protein FliJ